MQHIKNVTASLLRHIWRMALSWLTFNKGLGHQVKRLVEKSDRLSLFLFSHVGYCFIEDNKTRHALLMKIKNRRNFAPVPHFAVMLSSLTPRGRSLHGGFARSPV
ncbi:hypothetical protein FB480_11253 [Agrobacterium vitis]|nr:hypothetical protein FB480_11253 [Agrobacterium vitis]